ncbi:cell division/cell wall cluster transcriptional repressor MraZ [Neoehrlichia mikurensis]|uniref:Transcriptional regulator MraZ n=1 Tax=Neoehrlichia mikurensis TaxID=89586 RepID=A0A9Q9BSS4_9RICK|nr:cell division/cell wall cluster transcriptional repressor MraZ [Neoehrlichia mikurensis]QXK91980.1 cell division/cell wall cluster transcriptional repressor MraZ [Neoehrlichia mikurensis]QXK92437.1 cell division/cell wall cluster transcriptional repressor MraZ [Neoehrlichia mikurensis]QXK93672.1 cell division/cell wall cluster transcriptional repressor MraZ [Neoehrlichia mikurensis]UTO55357.1 cell division/cell wall cluster transcriptional repressor MraZ [Neoehrlichia mikurensis]UTO56277.1 
MKLFLSTYYNKVDVKGRVSIPASFRLVLENENSILSGLIINKSYLNDCLEGSSIKRMEMLNINIEQMQVLPEIKDAFFTFLLGNSINVSFDQDGRVVIPKKLLSEVGIKDQAIFVGKGRIFEIWNPDKFEKYKEKMTQIVESEKDKIFFNK